jgi:hypothetical protein
VSEKSGREGPQPATDSALRPGDFALGSRESRAAARALLEQRKKPSRPPSCTIDLSFMSLERCQEIYAKVRSFQRGRGPNRGPYMLIRFPPGFTPIDPANIDRSETKLILE